MGESVVMIGGGLVGCETALYLAQKGKKVTIVEILDSVARDMWRANRLHLLELLAKANMKILTETRVLEIRDDSIIIADKDDNRDELKCDTVILAVGLIPNNGLQETLMDKAPEVYAIGDCVEPGKAINAIWGGFRKARLI